MASPVGVKVAVVARSESGGLGAVREPGGAELLPEGRSRRAGRGAQGSESEYASEKWNHLHGVN